MRVPLGCLAVLAGCFVLPPGFALAHAVAPAAVPGARVSAHARHTELSLAPAPGDLALVEVRFPHSARGQRIVHGTVSVSVPGTFGGDYMALGASFVSSPQGRQAMLLVANRPSPLFDPARVNLLLSTLTALGRPVLRTVENPLSRPSPVRARELCDLRSRERMLGRSSFGWLQERGASPASLPPAWAISQAYDLVCSLPYSSVFLARVLGTATATQCAGGASLQGALCCPVTALCAPAPPLPAPEPIPPGLPPTPHPPVCVPCEPPPGSACPLQLSPGVCIAPLGDGTRRAAPGAY